MSKTYRRNTDGKKDNREFSGGWSKTESDIRKQERRKERHESRKVVFDESHQAQ